MKLLNPQDLLLAPRLDAEQVALLLRPYGFREVVKADANLQAVADDPRARQLLATTFGGSPFIDARLDSPHPIRS